jgi:hypothetical protein
VTEDTFRIVVAAAVALACIAFVVQAVAMFALYRLSRRMQKNVEPLTERAELVIGRLAPMIDKIGLAADKVGPVADRIGVVAGKVAPLIDEVGTALATANRIMQEIRPRIAELSGEAV